MSKPMTFEEWILDWVDRTPEDDFELARLGMIPEDEAVRIPDVGERPTPPPSDSALSLADKERIAHEYLAMCGKVPSDSGKVREAVDECGWSRDEWSESWSAGCGAEWIFPDGGPAENDMKFCPSCGKPVALAAPSSEVTP